MSSSVMFRTSSSNCSGCGSSQRDACWTRPARATCRPGGGLASHRANAAMFGIVVDGRGRQSPAQPALQFRGNLHRVHRTHAELEKGRRDADLRRRQPQPRRDPLDQPALDLARRTPAAARRRGRLAGLVVRRLDDPPSTGRRSPTARSDIARGTPSAASFRWRSWGSRPPWPARSHRLPTRVRRRWRGEWPAGPPRRPDRAAAARSPGRRPAAPGPRPRRKRRRNSPHGKRDARRSTECSMSSG